MHRDRAGAGSPGPIVARRTGGYPSVMPKLVIALAMFLVQAQPIAGAVLCQRHHETAAHTCSGSPEAHHDATHHGEDESAPADEECAQMLACSPAPPAVVPTDLPIQARPSISPLVTIPPTASLSAVAQARPFHPPRA